MNSVTGDGNEEVDLPGGNVGGATRVGRTVRRPTGPWTPAVHELLGFLNEERLRGVPAVLGIDDQNRETLSYVEGRGVQVDQEIVLDTVLEEAVIWLRDYHDIIEGFRPEGPKIWRGGESALGSDEIICHNDPGAYNWIVQGGHFVAMIDWDVAGPGKPIDDLAFLAWTALPLYREIPLDDLVRRLDILVDAYGEWGPMTVLHAVADRMTLASDRIAAGQERGDPGMLNLARAGEPQRTRDRVSAFQGRLPEIEAAL